MAIAHEAGVDAGAGHQAGEVGGVGAGDTPGPGGGAGGPAAVRVRILGVIPLPAPAGGVVGLGSAGLEPWPSQRSVREQGVVYLQVELCRGTPGASSEHLVRVVRAGLHLLQPRQGLPVLQIVPGVHALKRISNTYICNDLNSEKLFVVDISLDKFR